MLWGTSLGAGVLRRGAKPSVGLPASRSGWIASLISGTSWAIKLMTSLLICLFPLFLSVFSLLIACCSETFLHVDNRMNHMKSHRLSCFVCLLVL